MNPLIILGALWYFTKGGGAPAVTWPAPSAPPPPAPPPPGAPAHAVVYHRGKPHPAARPAARPQARPAAVKPAVKPAAPPAPDRVRPVRHAARKRPAPSPGPFVQPVPVEAHPAAAATFPEPVRPMTPAAVPTGATNVSIRDAQEILVALGYEKDLGPAGVDGSVGGLYGKYTKAAWAKAANAQGLDPTFARVGPQTATVEHSTYFLLSKAARRSA